MNPLHVGRPFGTQVGVDQAPKADEATPGATHCQMVARVSPRQS
jgi:hypothetical protein